MGASIFCSTLGHQKVRASPASTSSYWPVYPQGGGATLELIVFSYSDLAGDIDRWRSTTGVLFKRGAYQIIWQSQKQKVVALSTCEAEYIATGNNELSRDMAASVAIGDHQGRTPSISTQGGQQVCHCIGK